MKKLLVAALLVSAAAGAMAQNVNVGASINIGGPGYYGRIDIGNLGAPPVLYREPIIVERQVRYVEEPMYLRVPPGHAKHWSKHCRAYGACNRRVYFVQDSWYNNTYAPSYRRTHGEWRDERRDERRDYRHDDRGYDKHDKHDKHGRDRDDDRGDDRGHGNGHGRGHDKH